MELIPVLVVVGIVVVAALWFVARRTEREPDPRDQPTIVEPDASAGDPHRPDGTAIRGSGPDRAAHGKP